jgi:uncharacterized coiled-coil protein SlyX
LRTQQLADGTYVRVLTDVESKLLERIKKEEAKRLLADHVLKNRDNALAVRVDQLNTAVAALSNQVSLFSQQLNELAQQFVSLQSAVADLEAGTNAYTKEEVAGLLALYRVEEIAFPYQPPANEYFDRASQEKIRTGYASFLGARLKEEDPALPAFTMRRYTIGVRVAQETNLPLTVTSQGHAAIYVNAAQKTAVPEGSNGLTVVLLLPAGWSRLQFLTANQQPGNFFDIGTNLAGKVDAFSCLAETAGLVNGELLVPYSVSPDKLRG